MHAFSVSVYSYEFAYVDLDGLVFLISCISFGPYTLPVSFSAGFFEPQGEENHGDFPFRAKGSNVSHSVYCLFVGLCTCSYLLKEKAFLRMTEQGRILVTDTFIPETLVCD